MSDDVSGHAKFRDVCCVVDPKKSGCIAPSLEISASFVAEISVISP